MAADVKNKKRYQLGDDGAIFVPNCTKQTLEDKVKSKEWVARPDLDKAAEKQAAEAAKKAAEKPADEAPKP